MIDNITARIPQNQPIVNHLLRIRRRRRANPTQPRSFNATGYENGECYYACEYAYFLGARTVAEYGQVIDYGNLDAYIDETHGVAGQVRKQIIKVLCGQEWGSDSD